MSYIAEHGSRNIEIVRGDRCYLYDANGKKYLDFVAGWCVGNVGWNRKEVAEAVRKEIGEEVYVPQFLRSPRQERFAELLVRHAPNEKLKRVYRCTSGSEAVEFALKAARASTGKPNVVSIDGVYHGHTYGAAAVGDACTPAMGPCPEGFLKIGSQDALRGGKWEEMLSEFEALIAGRGGIAAFMTEPVFTNAGVFVPPPEFLPRIEKLCRKNGILFVTDEVATGFGRCGRLFAGELWGLSPDIVCLGKGLTGGYGTMGATLVTEDVFKNARRFPSYSTFGWVANDVAAAQANVEIILKEKLWENAERLGEKMRGRLSALAGSPLVKESRGTGLLIGIDIVKPGTDEPDPMRAAGIADACAERGLLIETAWNALYLAPPLILSEAEAEEGMDILESVFREG